MNTSWHTYGKIYAIGHAAVKNLFNGEVLIEEKVDGSQFSFGVFNGEIKCRSKGKEQHPDAPDDMFKRAIEVVRQLAPNLRDGYTYRGEYLQKPKHNALSYDRTPTLNIILFDIASGEECYLNYEDKKAEAERIGLEVVPLVFKGIVTDVDMFKSFLEATSVLGGKKIEGVVVKNYAQFDNEKKSLKGKFVSEEFKEVHKATWGEANPGKADMLTFLGMKYATHARWHKAVQHLKENGVLTDSPKDIGNLMKEVQRDVEEECLQEIMETLANWALPHIRRKVISGIPDWYKEQLLQQQFKKAE